MAFNTGNTCIANVVVFITVFFVGMRFDNICDKINTFSRFERVTCLITLGKGLQ